MATIYDLNGQTIGFAQHGMLSGGYQIFAGRNEVLITQADYVGSIDRRGYVRDAGGTQVGWVDLSTGRLYREADPLGSLPIASVEEDGHVYAYRDYHGLSATSGWRATVDAAGPEAAAAAAGYWFLLGGARGAASRYQAVPTGASDLDRSRVEDTHGGDEGGHGGHGGHGGPGGGGGGGLGVFIAIAGIFLVAFLFQELGYFALVFLAAPLAIAFIAEAVSLSAVDGAADLKARFDASHVVRALSLGFFASVGACAVLMLVSFLFGWAMPSGTVAGEGDFLIEVIAAVFGIVIAVGEFCRDEDGPEL